MNRFARIMQAVGWFGVALLATVWVQGFGVRDEAPQLARHTVVALAAACFCVLPHLWAIAYLSLAARGRRELERHWQATGSGGPSGRLQNLAWVAALAAVTAVAGLGGSFFLAGAILSRRVAPATHALAGGAASALQIVALLLERRALLADRREMSALEERRTAAAPSARVATERPAGGAS